MHRSILMRPSDIIDEFDVLCFVESFLQKPIKKLNLPGKSSMIKLEDLTNE